MFKAGDKVKFDYTDETAEIQFGPVVSSGNGEDAYLVKWLDGSCEGRSSLVWTVDLSALPKFEVGQMVKISYDEEELVVVAGPYPSDGDNIWVLKDHKGDHYTATEDYMSPVSE